MQWSKGALVAPLDERWRDILDGVAAGQKMPTSREVKALGAAVARLSEFYNGLAPAPPPREGLAARLSFSFVRDVPKGAAAVAELLPTLDLGASSLRVLDLGAGLGAMTWGAARALVEAGFRGEIEATFVDRDAQALALASKIVAAAAGKQPARVRATTMAGDLAKPPALVADLVLVGQAFSEMDHGASAAERAARHAEILHTLLETRVAEGGALVVVEPALRERTRHLHALRGLLVGRGWSVYAPCLHDQSCPMEAAENDWCHEDLPVDLPGWLVPAARAAGLRYQGLTFSYLVLRRDRRALRALLPAGALRAVRVARKSKGRSEIDLCGGAALLRADRLDRDATERNEAWGEIERGDLLTFAPPLAAERPRVTRETSVAAVTPGGEP